MGRLKTVSGTFCMDRWMFCIFAAYRVEYMVILGIVLFIGLNAIELLIEKLRILMKCMRFSRE